MMQFTYEAYTAFLKTLREHGYQTVGYKNWQETKRCVILRHDIDFDIDKAVKLASAERSGGVASTYFAQVSSDFYNIFSKKSSDGLKQIIADGHAMGLHFDEARYREIAGNAEAIKEKILEEADLLGRAVGNRIDIVSMHRPSKLVLDEDIEMPGMINSYGRTYSKDFKYLSDSRRKWKELVEEIIASEEYERLHILTHAFWYKEEECDLRKTVMAFVNSGNREKYESLNRNFTDLETVMRKEDIL